MVGRHRQCWQFQTKTLIPKHWADIEKSFIRGNIIIVSRTIRKYMDKMKQVNELPRLAEACWTLSVPVCGQVGRADTCCPLQLGDGRLSVGGGA